MDIAKTLSEKYNGTQWNLVANDYDQLAWDDTNAIPKPSLEELEQKWQEILSEKPLKLLRQQRDERLAETDKYTSVPDYPHGTELDKQKWLDHRQTLRDIPTLVTPLDDGSIKLWVTDQDGPLQAGDGLVVSSNVAGGYFAKGEPAVVSIQEACDFSTSTSEIYYSNVVSVFSNVETVSNTAQPGFVENAYWTSNTVSHYTGNVVSHYSNVVVYDGVSVYSNIDAIEYSNLTAGAQSLYEPIEVTTTSAEQKEGFTPVLRYSNVSADQYDANAHAEYTKVITHYSNISSVETVEYSNITQAQYDALVTVIPGYTSFFHEISNTSITVEQYARLTPKQREEYEIVTHEPITSNLQPHYTRQTKTTPREIRYLDATGAQTDEANCVYRAAFVGCTWPI